MFVPGSKYTSAYTQMNKIIYVYMFKKIEEVMVFWRIVDRVGSWVNNRSTGEARGSRSIYRFYRTLR